MNKKSKRDSAIAIASHYIDQITCPFVDGIWTKEDVSILEDCLNIAISGTAYYPHILKHVASCLDVGVDEDMQTTEDVQALDDFGDRFWKVLRENHITLEDCAV